jgi:hypothetical protein
VFREFRARVEVGCFHVAILLVYTDSVQLNQIEESG